MRVLHVIPGVPPRAGGPTAAVFGMVRTLRRAGVEAEIATTNSAIVGTQEVPLGELVEHCGVPIRYFSCPVLRKYGFSPSLARWLHRSARSFDLVHVHGIFAHPFVSATTAARRWGVPYIVRPSGELGDYPLRKSRAAKRAFLRLYGLRAMNSAVAIHVTSAAEEAAVRRLELVGPLVTVPLGVERIADNLVAARGEFRSQLRGSDNRKILLLLARIDPIKGLDLLLEALGRLKSKRKDFVLLVAGSGLPKFQRLVRSWVVSQGLEHEVSFLGFIDGRKKMELLLAADVFVLPSYHENFGISVLEAMAAGVPVVLSDQVGVCDEVQQHGAGIVVPCSATDLATGLERLLDNEDLRRRLGDAGRRLVDTRFTWRQVGADLLSAYSAVLGDACPHARPPTTNDSRLSHEAR